MAIGWARPRSFGCQRFARIAPRQARLVADMIRGMKIEAAMNALAFSKRRGAWYFKAVLRSALANAQE